MGTRAIRTAAQFGPLGLFVGVNPSSPGGRGRRRSHLGRPPPARTVAATPRYSAVYAASVAGSIVGLYMTQRFLPDVLARYMAASARRTSSWALSPPLPPIATPMLAVDATVWPQSA